jgi:hypothetical protein
MISSAHVHNPPPNLVGVDVEDRVPQPAGVAHDGDWAGWWRKKGAGGGQSF